MKEHTIEDLLIGTELDSHLLRKNFLPTGQFSTDLFFNNPEFDRDISVHENKIFVNVFKPLLKISDCYVRIKDLARGDFNFVFIIKTDIYDKLVALKDDTHFSRYFEGIVDRNNIERYKIEIKKNNLEQYKKYVLNNKGNFDLDDQIKKIKQMLNTKLPFNMQGVSLDLYTITRILAPAFIINFPEYLKKTKEALDAYLYRQKLKKEFFISTIEEQGLHFNTISGDVPTFSALYQVLAEKLRANQEVEFNESDIVRMIRENFDFIKLSVEDKALEETVKYDGSSFNIMCVNKKIDIKENGKNVGILNEGKANFLKKEIRKMLFPEVTVKELAVHEDRCLVIYLKKIHDVCEKLILSKQLLKLKLLSGMLRLEKYKNLQGQYENTVSYMIRALERMELQASALDFFHNNARQMNIFARIMNLFFSKWKTSAMRKEIDNQQHTIRSLTKEVAKANRERNKNYDPAKAALNIIKENIKFDELKTILNSKKPADIILKEIFDLYDQIGKTNKAVIMKNKIQKEEFLHKLKDIVG